MKSYVSSVIHVHDEELAQVSCVINVLDEELTQVSSVIERPG